MENEPIWQHRSDVKGRLKMATYKGNCKNSDLLGAKIRNAVTNSMTAPQVASNVFKMRQSSMQNRWRLLVELCADKPLALGFMQVDGGLRGLAVDIGEDHSTLCRNLNSWESREPPLVLTGHAKEKKTNVPLVLIHIPLLTRWLLWVAEARASFFSGKRGVIDTEMILEIVRCQVPLGLSPPVVSELSWVEAKRLVK